MENVIRTDKELKEAIERGQSPIVLARGVTFKEDVFAMLLIGPNKPKIILKTI